MNSDDEEYFYDQAAHRWISESEMRSRDKFEKISNTLIIFAAAILCGGGFLWMLITVLDELF